MNATNQRSTYLIDQPLQQHVVSRVMFYGMTLMLFVILALAFWETFFGVGGLFTTNLISVSKKYSPVLLAMVCFIPFMVYDSIKLTHKIAGPLYRLRQDLTKFKAGQPVNVNFRSSDFLQDIPERVNELLMEVSELRAAKGDSASSPNSN